MIVHASAPADARISVERRAENTWIQHWTCGGSGQLAQRTVCSGPPELPSGEYRIGFLDGPHLERTRVHLSAGVARIEVAMVKAPEPHVSVTQYLRAPDDLRLRVIGATKRQVAVRLTNDSDRFVQSTWYADGGPNTFWLEAPQRPRSAPLSRGRTVCGFGIDGFVLAPGDSIDLEADVEEGDVPPERFVVLVDKTDSRGLRDPGAPWRAVVLEL